MTKKLKRKQVRPAPLPERRAGEILTPAFHGRIIVKNAPGLTVKGTERAVRQVDETRRLITFVASEELADRDGDIVRSAGIDATNYRKNPVFLVDHDQRRPIGKTTDLRLTVISGHPALVGQAELLPAGASAVADGVWREIVGGVRAAVSIGFLLKDFEPRFEQGRPVGRILREVELLEISSVVLPSCPSCLIVAASGAKSCCAAHDPAALAARTAEVVAGYYRLLERAVKAPLALPAPGSIGYTILNHADANHMYGRNVAVALVKEACDELKIQMAAAVELIREARESETPDFYSEKGIGGCTFVAERKIYLRYDLLGGDLAECAGHEAYHLTHRGGSEEEATRFGRAFAAKALGHAPRQPSPTWEQCVAVRQALRSMGIR